MWKETKISVFDRKLEEITGIEKLVKVSMSFDVNKIVSFREDIEDGESETNKSNSVIYLTSGESFIIDIPYIKLKQLLNVQQ